MEDIMFEASQRFIHELLIFRYHKNVLQARTSYLS